MDKEQKIIKAAIEFVKAVEIALTVLTKENSPEIFAMADADAFQNLSIAVHFIT